MHYALGAFMGFYLVSATSRRMNRQTHKIRSLHGHGHIGHEYVLGFSNVFVYTIYSIYEQP